ncbi:acyltransferase [Lacimicrobium sp. SS2-24]|uniref:acyltransferase n=1 Tax=Lacimicrobium sp. SS2-24 TaxID=2005569 RepID=UPI000B4B939A|nr:acyltransferase [Lacimicrobium sp. SS2-24]
MRLIILFFYYAFAQFLPANELPVVGKLGRFLRFTCIKRLAGECGSHVNINRRAHIGNPRSLRIGDFSGIGTNCRVANDTIIGRYVMMGPDVVIFSKGHYYSDTTKPMMFQGTTEACPVVIDDDVWIGQRVMIMPGVKVGQGAILAAGAIVTKDVPEYAIMAGNPAKQVKSRQND